ncbi:hypothetical protein KZ483_04500 [Paenibacillus sp. sptzw28]|uniref:Calx-beta domain-containing protein n=1 Tax=Paenibacillus sp. sptzw28 TaxID=715179 RepID=UPI001C6F1159|nr:Calx-beta domain-containing protein [Paenibacillus sp. sptzw28]QYR22263.1 hypothetical protein KZ483_04500 [Paenibacillus sp. sptzw28]
MQEIRSTRQRPCKWKKIASLLVMFVLVLLPFGALAHAEEAVGEISISADDYVTPEDRGGFLLNIKRTGGSSGFASVSFTIGGSAKINEDYEAYEAPSEDRILYFEEGVTLIQFIYITHSDSLAEGDENITFTLSDPYGATLGNSIANVLIADEDYRNPAAGEISLSAGSYSAGEGDGYANLTVNRTNGAEGAVAVDYRYEGCYYWPCSANEGEDYLGHYGYIILADGETSKTIQVPLIDDSVYEGDENFHLVLQSVSGGATIGSLNSADVTILENEPHPMVTLESGTYTITETGYKLSLNVLRENNLDAVTTVDYMTASGTAEAGSDFIAKSGTLTFNKGQSSALIEIEVRDDTVYEGDETFTVTLSNPTMGKLGQNASGQVTIFENDPPPSEVEFSALHYYGLEKSGQVTVVVTRTGYTGGPATVDYATGSGTAIAGEDFVSASGTLTFAPGESSKTIPITLIDDKMKESFETFSVQLAKPTGGAFIGNQGKVAVTIYEK